MAEERKEAEDVVNNPEADDVSATTTVATTTRQRDERRAKRAAQRAAYTATLREAVQTASEQKGKPNEVTERTGSRSALPMSRRQERQELSDDDKQVPTTPVLVKQHKDIKSQDRSVERRMKWNKDRRSR